jgi:predicted ATPase
MISGAPGVGKSRLAGEIAAEAIEKGFVALLGDCYEGDDTVPFMPVVEILEAALAQAASREVFRQWLGDDAAELARLMPQLRRIFTDIPPPLEVSPEHSRRILFRGVAEVLARAAGNRPLLLLLEDLHWADEGTLSLLNYLARWVPRVPVMIVGTYREKEIDPAHGLARVIEDFIRLHVVERIDLEGLPHHAVADMIEALSGRKTPATLVALIYSNTEGNPFFIEELYQHLVERGNLLDPSGEFRTISRKSTFPRACAW